MINNYKINDTVIQSISFKSLIPKGKINTKNTVQQKKFYWKIIVIDIIIIFVKESELNYP